MSDARLLRGRRLRELQSAIEANGCFRDDIDLDELDSRAVRVTPHGLLWIDITVGFGRRDDGSPLLPPIGDGGAPYVIIEEWISVLTEHAVAYNYDLVDPGLGFHYGLHLHGHGGPPVPHRQGSRIDHEILGSVVGLDEALWELVRVAFEVRAR